jgi:hypothetical protein
MVFVQAPGKQADVNWIKEQNSVQRLRRWPNKHCILLCMYWFISVTYMQVLQSAPNIYLQTSAAMSRLKRKSSVSIPFEFHLPAQVDASG